MISGDQSIRLDSQVAIVTGGGGGLGRSHALLLAELGASVVVNDLGSSVGGDKRDESRAQGVVNEIRAKGGNAVVNAGSVASPAEAKELVEQAVSQFGRLDVVVNNAGVLRDFPMSEFDLSAWQRVMDVHVNGAMFVTAAAWPHLAVQGGSIVSTTSASGLFGNDGQAAYGAAKAAIVGLTRCWAVEGAAQRIRANAVAPLAVTRMTDRSNMERVTGAERTTASDVIGDIFPTLTPDQVSPLVAWLANHECPANGQIFSVGGGRVARIATLETGGWTQPRHEVGSLRDNWNAVTEVTSDSHEPRALSDEFAIYAEALRSHVG